MSTILAIQREAHYLKLVQINQTFNKTYISNYAYCRLDAEATWEEVAQKSRQMIQEHNLESQKTILGLCSTLCFLRQLWFPFTKRTKSDKLLNLNLNKVFRKILKQQLLTLSGPSLL